MKCPICGERHISNQGCDSESHRQKKKVREGKFIDESGSPCDTCVDEQQFYGCPDCDFNPLAEVEQDFDDLEQEWDEYPEGYKLLLLYWGALPASLPLYDAISEEVLQRLSS